MRNNFKTDATAKKKTKQKRLVEKKSFVGGICSFFSRSFAVSALENHFQLKRAKRNMVITVIFLYYRSIRRTSIRIILLSSIRTLRTVKSAVP